jgi:hypothetical protein
MGTNKPAGVVHQQTIKRTHSAGQITLQPTGNPYRQPENYPETNQQSSPQVSNLGRQASWSANRQDSRAISQASEAALEKLGNFDFTVIYLVYTFKIKNIKLNNILILPR